MTDLLNIAYVQPDIKWHNIEGNLRQYDNMLADINDADLIVLPEMFATGFTNQIEGTAQAMDGSVVEWMSHTASAKKSVVMGSQIVADGELYYNRMLIVFPDGHIDWYDKRHLFRMGCENDTLSPGTEIKIFEYKGWRIRPVVCYDLRFPVWLRNVGNSYDLLVCVANWPTARHNVFEPLLRARSIENQCYTVGVNRVGTDGLGIDYSGGSVLVDIYGNVASRLPEGQSGVGRATVSLSKLNAFREKFPTILDADKFSIEIGKRLIDNVDAHPETLLRNLDKIHTTPMGADRIGRNLKLTDTDVVKYCKETISSADCKITRNGKNWYCKANGITITVNAQSYTIITAHRK